MRRLLENCGFENVASRRATLCRRNLFGVGPVLNALGKTIPLFDWAKSEQYRIFRPAPRANAALDDSLTICLTCRNERENIEPIVRAIPTLAEQQEILFVEGHSDDGTRAEIERVIALFPDKNIRVIGQPGRGQGDAIREGFSQVNGAIIILLEADMTSPPADIGPVYACMRQGIGEFVSGNRFAHRLSSDSMPLVNRLGNRMFARYFGWLFNQPMSDVLSGIKAIRKRAFLTIAQRWRQWGIDDPFGDFELLFGAMQIGLKFAELPIRYQPRSYGQSKTRVFHHGGVLARMAGRAFLAFRT